MSNLFNLGKNVINFLSQVLFQLSKLVMGTIFFMLLLRTKFLKHFHKVQDFQIFYQILYLPPGFE